MIRRATLKPTYWVFWVKKEGRVPASQECRMVEGRERRKEMKEFQ